MTTPVGVRVGVGVDIGTDAGTAVRGATPTGVGARGPGVRAWGPGAGAGLKLSRSSCVRFNPAARGSHGVEVMLNWAAYAERDVSTFPSDVDVQQGSAALATKTTTSQGNVKRLLGPQRLH